MPGRPAGEGVLRLVQELSPGGRLSRMRRLRGGLGARMHVLSTQAASGQERRYVLRRYVAGWRNSNAEGAEREFHVLQLAAAAQIPAPRPVLLDAAARFFDAPCMVLSYLPGRSFHVPRDPNVWASELARGLASVHAVTPAQYDLTWLPRLQEEAILENVAAARLRAQDLEPLAGDIVRELESRIATVDWSHPCLIHADFHPGNTVFARSKLSGIVDWSEAGIGDPGYDVAQCRLDLVLSHGTEAADAFRGVYEVTSGRTLHSLPFFDLERGFLALCHYERWLVGYHDAGLTHITKEAAGRRLRTFLGDALARAVTMSNAD